MSSPAKHTSTPGSGDDRSRSVSSDRSGGPENTGNDSAPGSSNAPIAAPITRDPEGIYLSADEEDQAGENARRVADNPGKHKPVTKKGSIFHWNANEHVSKSPPTLGVKSRSATEITLYDESGSSATFIYPRRHNLNFADQRGMMELQKWRLQIIKRKLDQNNDGQSKKTIFRQHWTDQEKDFLKELVLRNINKHRRSLNEHDWENLARDFNARFKGWPIKVGEATTPHSKGGGAWTEPSLVKKSHIMVERNAGAIKCQAMKYPDLKEEMRRAIESFGGSSSPDASDSEMEDETDEGDDDEEDGSNGGDEEYN